MKFNRVPVEIPNHAGEVVYRGYKTAVECTCRFTYGCHGDCLGACCPCRACALEYLRDYRGVDSWEEEAVTS